MRLLKACSRPAPIMPNTILVRRLGKNDFTVVWLQHHRRVYRTDRFFETGRCRFVFIVIKPNVGTCESGPSEREFRVNRYGLAESVGCLDVGASGRKVLC